VDRFVATIEKGKSVGRAPVNEEIVEDLLQRMEQSSKKNPSGSYHIKNLNFYSHKITIGTYFKKFDQVILRGA
jgi:RNA recognition motif-containing protein